MSDLIGEKIRIAVDATKVASAGVNPAGKLTAIIAGMACGADCIDDLDVIRSGGMRQLFNLTRAAGSLAGTIHAKARRVLGSGVADVVAPISLAPAGEQYARDLFTYKRDSVPPQLRQQRLIGLAAVLWFWLAQHEQCLAVPLGRERFDLITTVPSTSGRTEPHPLVHVVSGIVRGSADRYRPLVDVNRADVPAHQPALDLFRATTALTGSTVLIVDDTWTTGAHAQSASAALKAAGASGTAILTLGRWITPDYADHGDWLVRQRRHQQWSWSSCAVGAH